jgi:hypothetical protein
VSFLGRLGTLRRFQHTGNVQELATQFAISGEANAMAVKALTFL